MLVVPPSNPVVSVGTILGVPGIVDAVRTTSATVVGVSPIIGGSPVRGSADKLLPVIGVAVTAEAVGAHYGSRSRGGVLDGWLVDDTDTDAVPALRPGRYRGTSVARCYMSDAERTMELARATLGTGFGSPARIESGTPDRLELVSWPWPEVETGRRPRRLDLRGS